MAKSISKKILLFLLVTLTALSFAVSAIGFNRASAETPQFENSFDATKDYSEDELEAQLTKLKADVESFEIELSGKVVVDADKEQSEYLEVLIASQIASGTALNEVAKEYLFGDTGLNGLVGIYELAYRFYTQCIVTDANGMTALSNEKGFSKYVNADLIKEATNYLKNFDSKLYKDKDFDKTLVEAKITEFEDNQIAKAVAENIAQNEAINLYKAEVDYYRELYFGAKYGNEYTNLTVYNSNEDVSTEKATEVKNSIDNIFATAPTYSVAKEEITKVVASYRDSFNGLKSATYRAWEDILADSTSTTDELIDKCEQALSNLENLGTIKYFKKVNGEDVELDLKELRPLDANDTFLSDRAIGNQILKKYVTLIKKAIDDIHSEMSVSYGVSADVKLSTNKNYAKAIAECLGEYGKLGEANISYNGYSAKQYSYGSNNVVTGSDVIKAYKDSFTVDGALELTADGKLVSSSSLEEVKKVSSLKYVDKAKTPAYEITLTCMDGENEVNYFDAKAVLNVREGATPSILRNINLILNGKKLDSAASNIDESVRETLKGKVVLYYFTFTVFETNYKGKLVEVKNFGDGYDFVVKLTFKDSAKLAEVKDKTSAFNYRHTTINEVYDITWGDDYMAFTIPNLENQAQMAIVNIGTPTLDNLVTYAVFGIVGVIALLFLIWIIVAIIKNWKYRITFYARGGKYNTSIRVKVREKFNHPAPPKRKGYKFLGWYLDKEGTVKFAATELIKRKNFKVYAKWISDAEFEKLNEKYAVAATTPVTIVSADTTTTTAGEKRDSQIEKLEAEKLSYEAKKAEEERKTEEVKLQAIREIEIAKKNEEAVAKAEKDAQDAKDELDKAIAERDGLITDARADERTKCLEEIKAANEAEEASRVAELENAINKAKEEANAEKEAAVSKAKEEANAEKEAAVNKAKEEANAEIENAVNKAKEEANAEIENAVNKAKEEANAEKEAAVNKAKEEANAEKEAAVNKAKEEANAEIENAVNKAKEEANAEIENAVNKAKEEASVETEERLRREFEAESQAKAEEQARVKEELETKIRSLEEASAQAEENAKAKEEENEDRINVAIAAGIAAKLAEMAANAPVEEKTEIVEETTEDIVEEVIEEVVETPTFDIAHVFDELKAGIYSYANADDLGYGLEENVPVCAMKVVGETIELEVDLNPEDCARKGYNVTEGEKLPVKFVIASDEDVAEANELIEETMFINGFKKINRAVVTESTEQTREQGFEYGVTKGKVAETPEEFYKLLRVYAKSFVLADDDGVEDRSLIKMFLARERVYMYLNYEGEGLNACDEEMVQSGYKTFMTIKNVEDCKVAIKAISAMMKENGLIRYPSEVKIAGEDCTKGFTYTLKNN